MGLKMTVTSGLKSEHIKLFKGLNIYCFIGEGGIKNAQPPVEECKNFKNEVEKYQS